MTPHYRGSNGRSMSRSRIADLKDGFAAGVVPPANAALLYINTLDIRAP
jgi:hypothetical protein